VPDNNKGSAQLAASHRILHAIGSGLLLFSLMSIVGMAVGGSVRTTLLGAAGFGLLVAMSTSSCGELVDTRLGRRVPRRRVGHCRVPSSVRSLTSLDP
jgi:hypothetical protein